YPHKIHTDMPQELLFRIKPPDFRNIVHNLVENAAKYSPEHSDINISLTQKENQILFQVADHGIGIAAKNREKIFQRFYREDTSHSSKIKGSGQIGRASCRERMNIWLYGAFLSGARCISVSNM